MRKWTAKDRLYQKCVRACTEIMKKIDYHYDWCAGEDECLREVHKISSGTVYYWKPMAEALRNLGVDV